MTAVELLEVTKTFCDHRAVDDLFLEVDRWLERFDLAEWANKKVETLSKGMSRKVRFISAVVSRPATNRARPSR